MFGSTARPNGADQPPSTHGTFAGRARSWPVRVAVIALLGVGIATISVNIAANVVSPANDFSNLAPRWISFKTGGLITGILGIVLMPWKLMASASAATATLFTPAYLPFVR